MSKTEPLARVWRMSMSENPPLLTFALVTFRPRGVWHLLDALLRQSFRDIEVLMVMDDELTASPDGFEWVARAIRDTAPMAHGQYVVVVSDDDELEGDNALAELEAELVRLHFPDVLVVNLDYVETTGVRSVLPLPASRNGRIYLRGHIGPQCLVARRELWRDFAHLWTEQTDDGYSIDLRYMQALLYPGQSFRVEWSDITLIRMVTRGLGKPEVAVNGP